MILIGGKIEDSIDVERETFFAAKLRSKINWGKLANHYNVVSDSPDASAELAFVLWLISVESPPPGKEALSQYLKNELDKIFSNTQYGHIQKWIGTKPHVSIIEKLFSSVSSFDFDVLWEMNGIIFGKDIDNRMAWVDFINKFGISPLTQTTRFDYSKKSLTGVAYHDAYVTLKNKKSESL